MNQPWFMSYVGGLSDDAMPDLATIQAGNAAAIATMQDANTKAADMNALKAQMQQQAEMMPYRFAIGGVVVFFLIYWFLIR